MLLRAIKVYRVKIKEISRIPTKKDSNIAITHLQIDMLNEQLEQLAVSPYQISPTMALKSLYILFKVPAELSLDAFIGKEGYAEVLERLQLNNRVVRNIKRFIPEQEYNKLLYLNDQPSPNPVSDKELVLLKKQTLKTIKQVEIAKERYKKEETNNCDSTKPGEKISPKAVEAFENLMKTQKNNRPSFRSGPTDGYVEKTYPPLFERLLEKHSKNYTKAGPIGAYLILKARQDCEHKNGVSIKSFR